LVNPKLRLKILIDMVYQSLNDLDSNELRKVNLEARESIAMAF